MHHAGSAGGTWVVPEATFGAITRSVWASAASAASALSLAAAGSSLVLARWGSGRPRVSTSPLC